MLWSKSPLAHKALHTPQFWHEPVHTHGASMQARQGHACVYVLRVCMRVRACVCVCVHVCVRVRACVCVCVDVGGRVGRRDVHALSH